MSPTLTLLHDGTLVKNRIDFLLTVTATLCNPNGEGETNLPRTFSHSGRGWISANSVNHKLKEWLRRKGYLLYHDGGVSLEMKLGDIHRDLNFIDEKGALTKEALALRKEDSNKFQDLIYGRLLDKYIDMHFQGGVFKVGGFDAGHRNRSWHLDHGISVCPVRVVPAPMSYDTTAKTKDWENRTDKRGPGGVYTDYVVEHGHYVFKGTINPFHAKVSKLTHEIVDELFVALREMWATEATASKSCERGHLWVFRHETPLGNCPREDLYKKIRITPSVEVPETPEEYDIEVDTTMPPGVTMEQLF